MSRAMVQGSAGEASVRAHAAELTELAARHGVRNLRFASTGRLLVSVDDDRDGFDKAAFAADAEDLLQAPVLAISDAVLCHDGVSADLVAARPISVTLSARDCSVSTFYRNGSASDGGCLGLGIMAGAGAATVAGRSWSSNGTTDSIVEV